MCGSPLDAASFNRDATHDGAPSIPQVPPPFVQPPMQQYNSNRSLLGRSGAMPTTVNADARTAYDMTIQAIQAARGEVRWQSPPTTAKFAIAKTSMLNPRGFWSTFDGELVITQTGARQSSVRLHVKPQTSTLGGQIGTMLILGLVNSSFGLPGILFTLLVGAWYLYRLFGRTPQDLTSAILMQLGQGAPFAPSPQSAAPDRPPQPPAKPVVPGAVPHVDLAGARPSDSVPIMEQLKQLGALKDAGVLTDAEFDAKKAVLLSRF
ncbi:MAG: SHOCT domain-containing protein [Gemmatimonadota bacterium]|nr:SHOCT domain-containing protein [Gemmatimonadota bacterium]